MKKGMLLAVLCILLVGCDYTVALVGTPMVPIDRSVLGLWQRRSNNGQTERLLVLPLKPQEYLVSFPADSPKAMFARGCLWHGGGMTLVQLDWFGTAEGKLPMDARTFQYASYAVSGNTLRTRLLNPEVVKKTVASPAALARAIEADRADPRLFRNEMVFKKVAE